jgi:RNA-directed DNA polymerase
MPKSEAGRLGQLLQARPCHAYRFLDRYTTTRLRRWLCKKHKQSNGSTKRYPDEFFHQQMGLICLPQLPQSLPWAKA